MDQQQTAIAVVGVVLIIAALVLVWFTYGDNGSDDLF